MMNAKGKDKERKTNGTERREYCPSYGDRHDHPPPSSCNPKVIQLQQIQREPLGKISKMREKT